MYLIFDARGNGDGDISPTITGDHQNRITDYTAIVVEDDISEDNRNIEPGRTSGELQRTGCLQRYVGDK